MLPQLTVMARRPNVANPINTGQFIGKRLANKFSRPLFHYTSMKKLSLRPRKKTGFEFQRDAFFKQIANFALDNITRQNFWN